MVNTVERCQFLANALQEFDPICYHSKFIFRDRQKLEEKILGEEPPRLLIVTQVIEVALDIDYDLLLTECAPPDAIVQRAGRVNRARRKALGEVVIHPCEKGSNRVYAEPEGILESSWKLYQRCRVL